MWIVLLMSLWKTGLRVCCGMQMCQVTESYGRLDGINYLENCMKKPFERYGLTEGAIDPGVEYVQRK